jgi:hypothetical protein
MTYYSKFYRVDVREEIAKEFTNSKGEVDDMMAGLHEIRVRRAEEKYNLKELAKKVESKGQWFLEAIKSWEIRYALIYGWLK